MNLIDRGIWGCHILAKSSFFRKSSLATASISSKSCTGWTRLKETQEDTFTARVAKVFS